MNTVRFDTTDPAFLQNPYPTYRALLAENPTFFHDASGMWCFSRHADVDAILRDRRFGRAALKNPPENPAYEPFLKLGRHSMFDMEPPDHTRLRTLVHKAFTPKRIRDLTTRIQANADALLDAAAERGEIDLLADYAAPLSVNVIAALLGVPEADRGKLRPWSNAIVKMYELDHTPAQAQAAVEAAQDFADYLKALARDRRRNPQDDLITALALVEEAGDQLTEDELVSTCVLLLNAGHEATVNVVGNGMWALFRHPDKLNQLCADPSLIPTAVEELMRFDSPLQLFRRWVYEDVTIGGVPLKRGMEIALLFGAANHDPVVFAKPDALDLARTPNPHISFGGGVHYCLGAPLARLELGIGYTTLLTRFPNLQLITEPQFHAAYVIRGLTALHVRL